VIWRAPVHPAPARESSVAGSVSAGSGLSGKIVMPAKNSIVSVAGAADPAAHSPGATPEGALVFEATIASRKLHVLSSATVSVPVPTVIVAALAPTGAASAIAANAASAAATATRL
jgi:hypothetical protein